MGGMGLTGCCVGEPHTERVVDGAAYVKYIVGVALEKENSSDTINVRLSGVLAHYPWS